jgi:hypothetical protein
MKILDLFAGLGGAQRRDKIESRGHEYVTLDIEARFGCTITADILMQTASGLGTFDFVWASPPCEAFSVASIGHHWGGGSRQYQPKTTHAVLSQRIVEHTKNLCLEMKPRSGWLIENPRGVLRKLPCVAGLPRVTVSYCRYGDTRMKPTDLWGHVPQWKPRPMCHNGNQDHEAAPRGAKTGTQGIKDSAERAIVPWQLWEDLLKAIETPSCVVKG